MPDDVKWTEGEVVTNDGDRLFRVLSVHGEWVWVMPLRNTREGPLTFRNTAVRARGAL